MVWGCLLGSVASSQQLETDLALHQEQLTALRQKAQELVDQHHFESLSIQKKIKEVNDRSANTLCTVYMYLQWCITHHRGCKAEQRPTHKETLFSREKELLWMEFALEECCSYPLSFIIATRAPQQAGAQI